ncbi:LytR C-terminal domain-containing protein [Nocardia implantans]|uniref:LytR C-terminal domain-containing protein n=1 Tax=Nocardia implantans TaxID=3108168 RepID=A0ABU6AMG5_9NOCA|nr:MULTISPECIES: LytR C-terminal domain-containing protein [unclassified Nocardia]MBF6193319.1 LytR C-terminal domain-containing protein [Nocardia beijingensis]MEA3531543.1 LytR C-terminal domain-containing protein [Nocardia sp. CDC192]MEB3508419.1 LytR C-terminal domain-containing protein [Nocardia sp. CDC186]
MSYPNPTSGGPPLRALAMVLIALAIVFAGLGAMSLSNSDADTDASGTSESPTSSASAAPQVPASTTAPKASISSTAAATVTPTTTAAPTTSTAARSVPVRVLNNSMVPGLAAKTAGQLEASGWTIAETGNYPGASIAKTTVYYGDSSGDKEAAQAIADQLGASVAPKSSAIGDTAPGVTVIVTGN